MAAFALKRWIPLLLAAGGGVAVFLAFRKAAAALPAGPRRVAVLGDSITANGGYVRRLQALLPPGSVVKGFGVVGEGAKAAHRRLSQALEGRPTDLVVLLGVNDIASGRSLAHTQQWLGRIYAQGRAAGARVVAVTVTPWAAYKRTDARQQRTTAALNHWIRSAPVGAVVETGSMGDRQGRLLGRGDGLHPDAAGQRRLGDLIRQQAFAR